MLTWAWRKASPHIVPALSDFIRVNDQEHCGRDSRRLDDTCKLDSQWRDHGSRAESRLGWGKVDTEFVRDNTDVRTLNVVLTSLKLKT